MNDKEPTYIGFWLRFVAFIVDNIFLIIISFPLMKLGRGLIDSNGSQLRQLLVENAISFVIALLVILAFWFYKSATPGKLVLKTAIVDEKTGEKPSKQQFIVRYLGYYVSMFGLFIGFVWIAFDKKKRGWHDLMAGTVVVKIEEEKSKV